MSAASQAFDAAVMMLRTGKREDAASLCWEIVRRDRGVVEAWALMARIEGEAGRHRNALMYHAVALQTDPRRWNLWHDSAIDAMAARMYAESERSFRKALELNDNPQTHFYYGNLLAALMRVDESVKHYKRALAMGFDDPQIHPNLGTAMIGQGNWREGFDAYRRRFNAPGFPPHPRFNYPKWHGEPLAGKTIMLYVEQGFGDEIMSLRFAAPIMAAGATVILAVRAPMFRLARTFTPKAHHVILMYDPPPVEPDYMCALLDVPAFLDITPATIPLKEEAYLHAQDNGYRLSFKPGLNVGICWASGRRELQPAVAETARQKSLTFAQFAPLARPGVNLICLQQNHSDGSALRDLEVIDPMPGVTDFADTAFILSHLDLVITVDTSVAHLAGAMRRAVWNLTRYDALWPWMQEAGATSWYDSMTLYRQEQPFDWGPPLKRLMADFDQLVDQHRAAAA